MKNNDNATYISNFAMSVKSANPSPEVERGVFDESTPGQPEVSVVLVVLLWTSMLLKSAVHQSVEEIFNFVNQKSTQINTAT